MPSQCGKANGEALRHSRLALTARRQLGGRQNAAGGARRRLPGAAGAALLAAPLRRTWRCCSCQHAFHIPAPCAARSYIEQLVQQQVDAGIPSSSIVIGGFSQGGAMALLMLRSKVCGGRAGADSGAGLAAGDTLPVHTSQPAHVPASPRLQPGIDRPTVVGCRCGPLSHTPAAPCTARPSQLQFKLAGIIGLSSYMPLHEELPLISGEAPLLLPPPLL